MGVTTKKTTPMIIGAIKLTNANPNLNHILFKGVRKFELIAPRTRKIKEINIAQ